MGTRTLGSPWRGRLVDLGDPRTQQSSLSDPLLDQFIEGAEVRRPVVLRVTL